MAWYIIEEFVTVRKAPVKKGPDDNPLAAAIGCFFWFVVICALIGACSPS